ncbi:hypothetical protein CHS0354_010419 [Potamilus streckersoni]|uniref:Uncharacterized protein n=1 Tax=Potamilus streckersoni TaxID=2493646 RepID=A0AAE0VHA0_9BIVA|nr:hypothetical protein CHS0354_010419 [Potamilus streckersoni]
MGCDLSVQDENGSTPLHYAASDGNPDTVLSQRVNIKCENSQGHVPLDLALLRGQLKVCSEDEVITPRSFFNRPLRKMHELDDNVEEIIAPLKTVGEHGAEEGMYLISKLRNIIFVHPVETLLSTQTFGVVRRIILKKLYCRDFPKKKETPTCSAKRFVWNGSTLVQHPSRQKPGLAVRSKFTEASSSRGKQSVNFTRKVR